MTLADLSQKYADLPVDEERIELNFRHMGRFGKTTVYGFSFDTDNAKISAELCVKSGRISGFMPEKEPKEVDEWFFGTVEEYQEDFTPEECARLDRYLASILA